MNKEELYIEIIKVSLDKLEDIFREQKDKYRCWAIMSIRDVFSYTDPKNLTLERITKLTEILKELLLIENVKRDDNLMVIEKILEMGLTILPVTDYAIKKFGE